MAENSRPAFVWLLSNHYGDDEAVNDNEQYEFAFARSFVIVYSYRMCNVLELPGIKLK